jgi:hypothetical protein
LKGLEEELDSATNNLSEAKSDRKAKIAKKQKEECDEEEIQAVKDKLELVEMEGEEELEKLMGKIDAANEAILEVNMDIDGADAPVKILQRAEAKL